MPRAEVGSIKWLSNKMKAKGLQRLRWYCQMCEKQCRDENGFKCHMVSETHSRQMQVFAQRPGRYMDEFSRSFEADFMRFMRTRYCRTRVLANTVYCELIANKTHIHMNATVWVTLSEFVRYLQRSGKCEVDETPRGFYLTFIDPEKLAREELAARGQKGEARAEQLEQARLMKAVAESKEIREQQAAKLAAVQSQAMERTAPVKVDIRQNTSSSGGAPPMKQPAIQFDAIEDNDVYEQRSKRPTSMLDRLIQPEAKKTKSVSSAGAAVDEESSGFLPHPKEDSDEWVSPDLVVKICKPGWEFDGRKGIVDKLDSNNSSSGAAIVTLLRSSEGDSKSTTIRIDKKYLETVIPHAGRWVRVVMGAYRGHEGRVILSDLEEERSNIVLYFGPQWGDVPADIMPSSLEEHKHYRRSVKKQRGKSLLERGELHIDELPFDAFCKASPPIEFESLDVNFDQDNAASEGE